jgi:hypothetical protein
MHADTNLQVWLDVSANGGQTVVAPYVSTAVDVDLQYELKLENTGAMGSSSVAQSGSLHVFAHNPKRISTIRVTPQPGGLCKVGLVLRDHGQEVGSYTLDCSVK